MQPSAFPLILSYLQSGTQQRPLKNFERGLHQFTVGLELGEIPNVRWQDAKQDINGALHEAWQALIGAHIRHDWNKLPEAVQELSWASNPQLHTIASWQKRMDKFTIDHPAATAARAFLLEAKPLGEAAEKLKTLVVKRATKAPEEQKSRYVPPRASDGAIESIRTALEGITAQAYERLRSAFVESYTKELNDYLDEQRSPSTPAKIRDRKTPSIVWSCTKYEWEVSCHRYVFTIRPDAAEAIRKAADRDASDIRDKFIYKNLAKLASIVDAKQNFTSVDVIGYDVNLAALRGSLRIKFEDGSQFDVQNSVVWSRSIYNKPFLRFPLTFHDVKMPDGSKMKQPSEEKMNTEFSGRYYGTVRAPESERLLLESLGLRLGQYDTVRGVFPAEATYHGKERLASFSGDFEAELRLRAFKQIVDMSVDELRAEQSWHEWSTASGNALDHQAHEAVVSALNMRNKKAVAQRAFSTAPSNYRSPSLGE